MASGSTGVLLSDGAINISIGNEDLNDKKNPEHDLDDRYNMNHDHRGECYIFNQYSFDHSLSFCSCLNKSLSEREGTNADKAAMEVLFKQLKFVVNIYDDPTRQDIRTIIKNITTNQEITSRQKNSDCIVIIILSHGKSGGYIAAKDKYYNLDKEIVQKFTAKKCPSLADKPKIFIVQACRGENIDDGHYIQTDGLRSNKHQEIKIPQSSDFFIGYSTVPEKVSFRDPKKGTIYLQTVGNVLRRHYQQEDLLSMFTLVNKEVSEFETDRMKQCSQVCHSLRKKVYF